MKVGSDDDDDDDGSLPVDWLQSGDQPKPKPKPSNLFALKYSVQRSIQFNFNVV